ncbi:MAG: hypothetical protein GF387_01075 [Candidatus Portnoybacteria bacterium]|nr:hypothetical protein [Candidatus Portnoybacteria bacterium]
MKSTLTEIEFSPFNKTKKENYTEEDIIHILKSLKKIFDQNQNICLYRQEKEIRDLENLVHELLNPNIESEEAIFKAKKCTKIAGLRKERFKYNLARAKEVFEKYTSSLKESSNGLRLISEIFKEEIKRTD